MSTLIPETPSTPSTGDITWAVVEDGFHVASRAGEFVGYIDRQPDGAFRACNAFSQPVGDFSDVADAMRAVVDSGIRANGTPA